MAVRPLAELRPRTGENLLRIDDHLVYTELAGQGEFALLVHGFGASTYSRREVIPKLVEYHRVVALDLYGFGWTERPEDWGRYTRDGQVELILAVREALEIDRAHIVGHSYGGSIGMALAADHPERVRSLVLVDAAAIDYPMKRRKWFASVALFNWVYVRGLLLRTSRVEQVVHQVYHDDALVTDELISGSLDRLRVERAALGYRGLIRPLPTSRRRDDIQYGDLDIPTTVLWGAQDQFIPTEVGREHADFFPNARFVAIDGAGHAPMEEEPAEFLAVVSSFFMEIEGLEAR